MFKSAATKIAHNSTIPALSGNQELRPLQDLITAEKAVLIALQKLSVDFLKASDALRAWGLSEGDDLGDILGASSTVINHFSDALSKYASHGHAMREQLKSIRSREENLDEMKRRRRAVFRKADDADKKLSKMSPEHKNLQMQVDLLNRLRDEIRALDTDIMVDEAALGDFKRTATKLFLGLKIGGLMECCQKGSIAADFGKMVISEISEEKTQPGLHRAFYQGHAKTESLVTAAQQAVNGVTLVTVPTLAFRDRWQYYNGGERPSVQDEKPMPTVPMDVSDLAKLTPPTRTFIDDDVPPSPPKPFSQRQELNPWSQAQNVEPLPVSLTRGRSSVDDFGMNLVRSNKGPLDINEGSSGRFATFPVNSRPAEITHTPTYALDSLRLQTRHDLGPSFASTIADALEHNNDAGPHAFSPTVPSAPSSLPPLPSITPPSDSSNPWAKEENLKPDVRKSNLSDNDDALLAYLMSGDETPKNPLQVPEKNISSGVEGHHKEELPEDLCGPIPEPKAHERISLTDNRRLSGSSSLSNPVGGGIMVEREDGSLSIFEEPPGVVAGTSKSETQSLSTSQWSSEDEVRALNAAAAREIRLELEALHSSPPQGQTSLQHDSPERGRPRAGTGQSYDSSDNMARDHSPLAPPSAPFARRSLSPHPYPEMTSPGAASHSYTPHGFGGPASATLSQPPEGQYAARPLGLSPGQVFHPPRLQPGSSPLSGISITEHRLPSNNGSSSVPGGLTPGTRTISAAAFKKTRNMSLDNLSKGLPGSPYPTPGGGPRIFSASALPSPSHIFPSQPPENRLSQAGSEYDYIDAYLQPNSPHRSEFVGEGGYQTGQFSTDLEDSPLR